MTKFEKAIERAVFERFVKDFRSTVSNLGVRSLVHDDLIREYFREGKTVSIATQEYVKLIKKSIPRP